MQTLTAGKEKSLATAQSEQWPAGQQLCRKGPGHPAGLHMSPVCPGSRLGAAPGLHKQGQAQGRSQHHLSTFQTTQILCSELTAPEQDKLEQVQERATTTVRGESISPWGEAEGTGSCSWRKKDFSIMTVQYKSLKTKPGSSLRSMDGGRKRTGMSWNMEYSV